MAPSLPLGAIFPKITWYENRQAGQMIAAYKAAFFINHDKSQTDKLKLLPAFYD
jgi:hypothetical protein